MSSLDEIMSALEECLDGAGDKQLTNLYDALTKRKLRPGIRYNEVLHQMQRCVFDEIGYRNQMESDEKEIKDGQCENETR